MKKLLLFLALTSVLIGCSSDSTSDSQSQNPSSVLIGKWTREKTIEYNSDNTIYSLVLASDEPCYQMGYLEFKNNNSFLKVSFDHVNTCIQNPTRTGTWTLQGNNISLISSTVNSSHTLIVIDNNTIRFKSQNTDPNPYYAYLETEYKRVN